MGRSGRKLQLNIETRLSELLSVGVGTVRPGWSSPDRALHRFGLSESTRRHGLDQLGAEGLLSSVQQRPSEGGDFIDVDRRRLVHTLTMGLDEGAAPATAHAVYVTVEAFFAQ